MKLIERENMVSIAQLLPSVILGLGMLVYVGYCASNGGTHVRGKGWVSKLEAPKTYVTTQVIWVLFGLSLMCGPIIAHLLR